MDLRYGENPHQQAALYGRPGVGIAGAEQLHGKELSYNNLVDLDAAYQLAIEFSGPAVAIIKHTNPCGCAEQASLAEAYRKALECDPVSAYGGVIGINRTVDEETAQAIGKLFVEAIAAPGYSAEALAILSARKNLRLMRVKTEDDPLVVKSISGGYLAQTADRARLEPGQAVVKSQRVPTAEEWKGLEFGFYPTRRLHARCRRNRRRRSPRRGDGVYRGQAFQTLKKLSAISTQLSAKSSCAVSPVW
jgi:phosphoribosylaminoimidazolecarboxamide formyltransferase/IMP cyclohydrolase